MVVLWANLNFHSLTLRRPTGPRMVPLDCGAWFESSEKKQEGEARSSGRTERCSSLPDVKAV